MIFVPFISVFYGGFLPAGLFIYWIVSTLFSIVQQYLILGWGGMFPLFGWTPALAKDHTPRFPVAIPAPDPDEASTDLGAHRIPTSEPPRRPRPSDPANAAAARAAEGDDADMSAYQEFTGKTVEEALRNAREAFSVGLDDLDFEILTPGSRGVLGMGAEPARIVAAPRDALGGAAPKREAAESKPLPPAPPRSDGPRDDRPPRRDDRPPRRDDRPPRRCGRSRRPPPHRRDRPPGRPTAPPRRPAAPPRRPAAPRRPEPPSGLRRPDRARACRARRGPRVGRLRARRARGGRGLAGGAPGRQGDPREADGAARLRRPGRGPRRATRAGSTSSATTTRRRPSARSSAGRGSACRPSSTSST